MDKAGELLHVRLAVLLHVGFIVALRGSIGRLHRRISLRSGRSKKSDAENANRDAQVSNVLHGRLLFTGNTISAE